MINFISWKWKSPGYRTVFTAEHVNVWAKMVKRHSDRDCRLINITDDPQGITECETFPLWHDLDGLQNPNGYSLPSCYRRLKIFSAEATRAMGIQDNEIVFSMDLDIVIMSSLATLLNADHQFIGWRGIGSFRPIVYNGSLFKFRAGALEYLWKDFDPALSPRQTKDARYFGSDQAWMSYKFDGQMPGWTQNDGVYSYSFDIRRRIVPQNAIIVAFNGKLKPWDNQAMLEASWIRKHWK